MLDGVRLLFLIILIFFINHSSSLAWTETVVTADGRSGTLILPDGSAKTPVILLVPGSRPVDRDGNMPGMVNNSFKLLSEDLARRGLASFRFDKRGVATGRTSAFREEELQFSDYVNDVVLWSKFLGKLEQVSHVILLGHSQGALVVTMASTRSGAAALVLVAGAGESAGKIIERQLKSAGLSADVQARSRRVVALLERGAQVRASDIPPELYAVYPPRSLGFLSSWLKIDPIEEIRKAKLPILIVQGSNDIQVSTEDALRLLGAAEDAEMKIIAGMNHILKYSPADRAGNIQTYSNDSLPVVPAVVSEIVRFINTKATH
jgi:fermentation-respiration switch protein FrsA (DUF1100 family)